MNAGRVPIARFYIYPTIADFTMNSNRILSGL
jgi:hypothetical protein